MEGFPTEDLRQTPPAPTPRLRGSASPRECPCGRALPPPGSRGGRSRATCSPACRARRDNVVKKIRRRQQWVDGWRRLAELGDVSGEDATTEIRLLQCDINELFALLGGRV